MKISSKILLITVFIGAVSQRAAEAAQLPSHVMVSMTRPALATTKTKVNPTQLAEQQQDVKPATTKTTSNSNNVPTAVIQVGEYGENIYDAAKANNWTQANSYLISLKDAAKRLDNESRINENPNEDQLDGAIATLNKSVPAKEQLATMRSANQVTLLATNLSEPFNPQVPVAVAKLDYYGRQLEIGSKARDMVELQQTAKDISQTWKTVRPTVMSGGGSTQAQKFDSLVVLLEGAHSFNQYSRLATALLNQVDNLEKVFTS